MQTAVLLAAITFIAFRFIPWGANLETVEEPFESVAPSTAAISIQSNDCRYTASSVPIRSLEAPEKQVTRAEAADHETKANAEDQDVDENSGADNSNENPDDAPTNSSHSENIQ